MPADRGPGAIWVTSVGRVRLYSAPMKAISVVGGVWLVAALATPALAHFELQAPPAYSEQDGLGGPQKSEPCGQADPGSPVTPTNAESTFMEGSQIEITIAEKITHPGHYSVSIAQDQAGLPGDPHVTPGATACGTVDIATTPALPLLADGLFVHTSAFSAPQSTMVQLPAGFTCDHCVLQVTEFMSNHGLNNPGGCFYHHCATVTIAANAPAIDAGTGSSGSDAANGDAGATGGTKSGGCGAQGGLASGGLLLLVAGTLNSRRRRRCG